MAIGVGMALVAAALLAGGTMPRTAAPSRLSVQRMEGTVRALYALGPAAQGQPSKDAVREAIVARLTASGGRVKVLPFRDVGPAGEPWLLHNLLVSFNPAARTRVMLCAHWDTRLWAEHDPDPSKRNTPIPGANDGFSGVAVLVELADHLGKNPPPESLGVDLVFFDGEEGPEGRMDRYFLGSRRLAETWFETGVALPQAGVLIDMVGKKGLTLRREVGSEERARPVNDEIWRVARARGSPVFRAGVGPTVLDDHLPWLERGIPVVDLIDFDYEPWHTTHDTIDKLDPAVMVEVGEVLIDWLALRAGSPAPARDP